MFLRHLLHHLHWKHASTSLAVILASDSRIACAVGAPKVLVSHLVFGIPGIRHNEKQVPQNYPLHCSDCDSWPAARPDLGLELDYDMTEPAMASP